MNGWQRLWVVLTGFSIMGAVCFTYFETYHYMAIERYEARVMQADIQNPECEDLNRLPIEETAPPPALHNSIQCVQLYKLRQRYPDLAVPITFEAYLKLQNEQRDSRFWTMSIGFAISILLMCLVVYAFGAIIAWIIKGFRKPDQA